MTRNEYQELVEFLGPKFDAIEGRFDAAEGRLAKVEVGNEGTRHDLQGVAEGLTSLRSEMRRGFDDVRTEMREGSQTQEKVIRGLSERMDRWEGRTPRPERI